jgi:hypothetical protein
VGSCKLIPANEATSAPALKKCLTSDNESVISGYFKKKEGTSVERRKFEFKSTGGDLFALTFTNVKGTKTCQYKKLAK